MATGDCTFFVDARDPPSKQEILKAALVLFVRDGLCETSIRDIANASGFSNPALYKFFGTKDQLALYLFERCYLRLYANIKAATADRKTFAERLHHMLLRYAELLDEQADAVLLVHENLRHFWPRVTPATCRLSLLGLQMRWVEQGQREGAVRSDVNPKVLVAAMTGITGQFARMFYFHEFSSPAVKWMPEIERLLLKAAG